MKNKLKFILLIYLFFYLVCLPCYAVNLTDDLSISGFVSQGYMKTDNNNWFGQEESGSFDFSEFGMNFNFSKNRLRIGAQITARDIGEFGNNELFLDWAHGDYKFKDYFGIRVGKCKLPFGFYNAGRDIDMLRIPVMLPSSVYDESRRDISNSYRGAGIYGNISSAVGDFEYELWYGISEIKGAGMYEKGIISAMGSIIDSFMSVSAPRLIEEHFGFPKDSVKGLKYDMDTILNSDNMDVGNTATPGISIRWMPSFFEGLRIGISTQSVDPDVTIPVNIDADILFVNGTVIPFEKKGTIFFNAKPEYVVLFSGEYIFNKWMFASEYVMYKLDYDLIYEGFEPLDMSSIPELSKFTVSPRGWYLQANYEISDMFSAGIYYSEYYPDRADKKGSKLKQSGIDAHRAWQKEIVPTLRIDFNKNMLLKLETHFINGTAQLLTDFNPEGMSKNWILYTAKITFNF